MTHTLKLLSHSPEETQRIGEVLGHHAQKGDVFLLTGGLGAGKTCLAQGIAWGLGIQEYLRSPTFVLVAELEGRLKLYHMDLYRLDNVAEVVDLGLDDYLFGQGICVVEWADKAEDVFPTQHLLIQLSYVSVTQREFFLTASDQRYETLIDQLQNESPAVAPGN